MRPEEARPILRGRDWSRAGARRRPGRTGLRIRPCPSSRSAGVGPQPARAGLTRPPNSHRILRGRDGGGRVHDGGRRTGDAGWALNHWRKSISEHRQGRGSTDRRIAFPCTPALCVRRKLNRRAVSQCCSATRHGEGRVPSHGCKSGCRGLDCVERQRVLNRRCIAGRRVSGVQIIGAR